MPLLLAVDPTPGAPGELRWRLSPSGEAELLSLQVEETKEPAVAVLRGKDAAQAAVFFGFSSGLFLGERELLLGGEGVVAFASEAGALGPTFEASWPAFVQENGERVALVGKEALLVLDRRGKVLARGELPTSPWVGVVHLLGGGGALLSPWSDESGPSVLLSAEGKRLRAFSVVVALAVSEDGGAFAVVEPGDTGRTVTAFASATGATLASLRLPGTTMAPPPRVALSPSGDRLVVAFGADLHVVDLRTKRARKVAGFPARGGLELREVRVTSGNEACLWHTDATGRSGSCEATHLVDLATGTRRALGAREACVVVGERAVRVKLPAPGKSPIPSSYFGPGGVCSLEVSGDLRTAARLEGAGGREGVEAVVIDLASGKPRTKVALPTPEGWNVTATIALSPGGERLAMWVNGGLQLLDGASGKLIAEAKSPEPPRLLGKAGGVRGLFSGAPIFDLDGRPLPAWPPAGARPARMPFAPPPRAR
jgi:hypothetical protein